MYENTYRIIPWKKNYFGCYFTTKSKQVEIRVLERKKKKKKVGFDHYSFLNNS